MSLRSSKHIQQEIGLRERIAELATSFSDADPWDEYASETNKRRLAEAKREFAAARGPLDWEFDGEGVYDHSITMQRLVELARPLGHTLRWATRDFLVTEGRPPGAVDIQDLAEPVLMGTFPGSFGLSIGAPPVFEQVSFEGSVFERAVSQVIEVFRAAHDEEPEASIAESVGGFRQRTLDGLKSLTEALKEAGRPSRIRWQGRTIVTVSSEDASLLHETIAAVNSTDREVEIQGILRGGDIDSATFHIAVPEGDKERHYRGKVEEGAPELRIELGTRVRATLFVIETDSRFQREPTEKYVLRSIESLGESR